MKQNAGVSNIEITDENIKAFEATAKKYGIDFALKKDKSTSPPRHLVFFKGRDADVLKAAFDEFSKKKLTKEKLPSVRKVLSAFKKQANAIIIDLVGLRQVNGLISRHGVDNPFFLIVDVFDG